MNTLVPPSGRRAGATWIAATGAFLLLAGAAVFVAVRWDQLPETAKFGLMLALTAAFLGGGRRLERTLPATGDVLFHLGACLVPVDVAAAAMRFDLTWRGFLLTEGLVALLVFGALAVVTRSVVLAWAATLGGTIFAVGVAGVSPLPAAAVLVGLAVAADAYARSRSDVPVLRRILHRSSLTWAGIVGLSPVLVMVAGEVVNGSGRVLGTGTLAELGFAGGARGWPALMAAAIAVALLARRARETSDTGLAGLALVCATVSAVSAFSAASLSAPMHLIGLSGAFLAVELAALLCRRDDFWRGPLGTMADLGEAMATVAAIPVGMIVVFAPFSLPDWTPEPALVASLATAALAWLVGDFRRIAPTSGPVATELWRGSGWHGVAPAMALYATAAAVATASGPAVAVAVVSIGALAVISRRPRAALVAGGAGLWAIACAGDPYVALVAGLAGAAVLAIEVLHRDQAAPGGQALAILATGTALAAAVAAETVLGPTLLPAMIVVCWGLSFVLDLGSRHWGDTARLGLMVPALWAVTPGIGGGEAMLALGAIVALLAVDAVRLARPVVGAGAALVGQLLILELAAVVGITGPAAGLALCVAAIAWAGLAAAVEEDWRLPFITAAVSGVSFGLMVASGDPQILSQALIIAGSGGVLAGAAVRSEAVAHFGGATVTLGIVGLLGQAGVTASEPYLTPIALQMLVAGAVARRRHQTGSWASYGPAIALLGGAALIERLAGGGGWHALVAGSIGLVAVAAGGWLRLAGPLLLGTALLVVLTAWESLAALAGIPTWAWLSLGGAILLGIGVALERTDRSPAEAGRRLVDLVGERFA